MKVQVTLLLIFLTTFGCQKEITTPPDLNNQELIFSNAMPLQLSQDVENAEIKFNVITPGVDWIRIGVFISPPLVINNELQNPEDEIWHFTGRSTSGLQVGLGDGVFSTTESIDEDFFRCATDTYYWGAWGWGSTASHIVWSTDSGLELSFPITSTEMSALSIKNLCVRCPGDTLGLPGSLATLEIVHVNSGDESFSGVASVWMEAINNTVLSRSIEDLLPGDLIRDTLTFLVPENTSYGDSVRFKLSYEGNDCYSTSSRFNYLVNASRPRLVQVILDSLFVLPPNGVWDDHELPSEQFPDLFYRLFLFGSVQETLDKSEPINNIQGQPFPFATWEEYSSPISLALNSNYKIIFEDENRPGGVPPPDYKLGEIEFIPREFFPERPEYFVIKTEEFQVRLKLAYQ